MSKTCQNFWKTAAVFTEILSLGFCEILLCLSNTNQKTLQNYERQPSPVNWKCTSYWKIFLSWDLGTVSCFLESCQAYIACKTNIQNQASSTAAKMLKSTWSSILSHPAQKSTTPTSSTSVQNGQHGLWKKKKMVRWKIIVSVSMVGSQHLRKLFKQKSDFRIVIIGLRIWTRISHTASLGKVKLGVHLSCEKG